MADEHDHSPAPDRDFDVIVGSDFEKGNGGRAIDAAIDFTMQLRGPQPWEEPKPPVNRQNVPPKK